jgi:hypothetical protein
MKAIKVAKYDTGHEQETSQVKQHYVGTSNRQLVDKHKWLGWKQKHQMDIMVVFIWHRGKYDLYGCDEQTDVSYWTNLVEFFFGCSLKMCEKYFFRIYSICLNIPLSYGHEPY